MAINKTKRQERRHAKAKRKLLKGREVYTPPIMASNAMEAMVRFK